MGSESILMDGVIFADAFDQFLSQGKMGIGMIASAIMCVAIIAAIVMWVINKFRG